MSRVVPLHPDKVVDSNPEANGAALNRTNKGASLPPRPHPIRANGRTTPDSSEASATAVSSAKRDVVFLSKMKKLSSEASESRNSVVGKFRESLRMIQSAPERNQEISEIERNRRHSQELAFVSKGKTFVYATARVFAGKIANSPRFTKLMAAVHLLNGIAALSVVKAFDFDKAGEHVNIAVVAMVVLAMYLFETGVKFMSLERGYFYYWMNVWDIMVLAVAITLLIDHRFTSFTFLLVLFARSLRHAQGLINGILAVRMMVQLFNGESVRVKASPSADASVMPYQAMARLLAKAKFTARFTEQEVAEVDSILSAITSNKLFAPNIDKMLDEMGSMGNVGGAEFANWVKQNFTANGGDGYTTPSTSSGEATSRVSSTHTASEATISSAGDANTASVAPSSVASSTAAAIEARKAHRKAKAAWNRPTASPCVTTPMEKGFMMMETASRDAVPSGPVSARPRLVKTPSFSSVVPRFVSGSQTGSTSHTTLVSVANDAMATPQAPPPLSSVSSPLKPQLSPGKSLKFSKSFKGFNDGSNAPISARALATSSPRPSVGAIPEAAVLATATGIITLPPIASNSTLSEAAVSSPFKSRPSHLSVTAQLSPSMPDRLRLDVAAIESEAAAAELTPGGNSLLSAPLSDDMTPLDGTGTSFACGGGGGPSNMSIVDYLNAEGQLCGSWQAFIYPVEAMDPAPKLPNNPYTQFMLTKQLNAWSFNTLKFSMKCGGEPLAVLFNAVMCDHNLHTNFNIPLSVIVGFGRAIEAQYMKPTDIPYHNNEHATDVLQSTHVILTTGNLGSRLNDLDKLSLLVAAAAHDVGHPGVNNSFLINTEDNEALLRNDQSVLEHMHAFICFNTMRYETQDILGTLSMEQRKQARTRIIALILGTDLQQHFDLVCRFKTKYVESPGNGTPVHGLHRTLTPAEESAGLLLQMQMALKIADISHPTKPWELHAEWTRRCMNEFFQQGDREKAAGLTVSSLMDRDTTKIPQAQIGFINVLVRPLLAAWTEANQNGKWDHMHGSSGSLPGTPGPTGGAGGGPHTPFSAGAHHTWHSPIASSSHSSSTRNVGLALCKTIEGFLNANAAQWQAMEESGSTPSLDTMVTDFHSPPSPPKMDAGKGGAITTIAPGVTMVSHISKISGSEQVPSSGRRSAASHA